MSETILVSQSRPINASCVLAARSGPRRARNTTDAAGQGSEGYQRLEEEIVRLVWQEQPSSGAQRRTLGLSLWLRSQKGPMRAL